MNVRNPINYFLHKLIEILLVYRVNWLRAQARFDRWDEDLEKVRNEMLWTTLWFDHEAKRWMKFGEESLTKGRLGHVAYAEKQSSMWEQFQSTGRKEFGLDLVK